MKLSKDPYIIVPYRTYSNDQRLYVRGRALEDQPVDLQEQQSTLRTLKNAYRVFKSDEIVGLDVTLTLPNGFTRSMKTDHEGYFLFNETLDFSLTALADDEGYVDCTVSLQADQVDKLKEQGRFLAQDFKTHTLIPADTATYGVISDIDDTIMHTGVTSFLKLKVAWNTFFKGFDRRSPLEGASEFYQQMHKGATGTDQNPIFYLSNSPWNLYTHLKKFLDFNAFPKGPILLRDFQTPWEKQPAKDALPHKQHELENILKTYPDLNFILIGDAGEHDADYYTDVSHKFPGRILAIYIRSVRSKSRHKKINQKISAFKQVPMLMVDKSDIATAHALDNGWIQPSNEQTV